MTADEGAESPSGHFLPQFLLKGFVKPDPTWKKQVYVFRKAAVPQLRNIESVARERGFYGAEIESRLSRRESKYAKAVSAVRRGEMRPDFGPLLGEFVRGMFARTRNIREGMAEMAEAMTARLARTMGEAETQVKLRQHIVKSLPSNPEYIAAMAACPPNLRSTVHQQAVDWIMRQDVEPFARILLAAVREQGLDKTARNGQLDGLRRGLDVFEGDGATAERATWVYQMFDDTSPALVLGDCGPLSCTSASDLIVGPFRGGADLTHLLLPVSARCLLIGWYGGEKRVFESEAINLASAELSRNFFVASRDTEAERRCLPLLGARAAVMTEADIEGIIRASVADPDTWTQ